jgi:hypothetical protein
MNPVLLSDRRNKKSLSLIPPVGLGYIEKESAPELTAKTKTTEEPE